MTHCIDFFRKFKKDGNFCGLDKSQVSRLNSYLDIVELLMKQNITEETVYTNFPVKAAESLISAKGDARTEGLNFATAALKEGKRVTQKDMQSTLQSCTNATLKNCSTTTSKPVSVPKPEETPQPEESKKPENTAGNYQPGDLVRTNLPPQPSLADQEYLKKYPVTAYCLSSGCSEIILHKPGLHLCKIAGMRPENHARGSCPVSHQHLPSLAQNQQAAAPIAPAPDAQPVAPIPRKAPCMSGLHCPDGESHLVPKDPKSIKGERCDFNGHEIKQLFKDECPLDYATKVKANPPAVEGFHRANNTPSPHPEEAPVISPGDAMREKREKLADEWLGCMPGSAHLLVIDIKRDRPALKTTSDVLYAALATLAEKGGA